MVQSEVHSGVPFAPGLKKGMEEDPLRKILEKVSRVPFLYGNSIEILKDGGSVFEGVFRALESARRLICLEYYIYRDDETGWNLAQLLARKSRGGVRVYLIYDHFGSLTTSKKLWTFLRSNGVEVRPFHPIQLLKPNFYFHRDHRKLVVIDGELAFTGGLNVGDEYRGYLRRKLTGWRDTGILVKGPIAGALLESFRETWKECGGGEIEFSLVASTPGPGANVAMLPLLSSSRRSMRALRQLLQFSVYAARKSIHLTMAYFIPSHKFFRMLLRVARRGVDVKIILPGQSDLRLASYASRTYYPLLLRQGVQIFHYQPRVLHAKTMVFDGQWSIVGSANLDSLSLNYNYECGVGILDGQVGEAMETIFAHDLLDSTPVTEKELFKWPLHERALSTFLACFRAYL